MSESVTVRPISQDDLDDVTRLKVIGFGGDADRIRADLESNPRFDLSHVVVAEIEATVVGVATAFPTQLWLSGVPVPAGAVAGVTTQPQYRRRGVAAQMMQFLLERMRRQGLAISILYPFSHAYYRKLGYGTASLVHTYRIAPANLPRFDETQAVRPFGADDLPAVRSLYRAQLSWYDGRLTRNSAWWNAILERAKDRDEIQVVYDSNGVEGYLRYRYRPHGGGSQILALTEIFTSSDAAYRGLWGYLAGQSVELIEYHAPPDAPLYQLLANPIGVDAQHNGWVFNEVYSASPALMLRVLDVAEALMARFYPSDMLGEVVIQVDDRQLPANCERISLRLVDGRPETAPAGDLEPDLRTDIGTLSQIYCGFLSPTDAHRLKRLTANEETLIWLSKAMMVQPLFIQAGDWF
jgi:predicted acetyltransferase